jgi:hypothetical protein
MNKKRPLKKAHFWSRSRKAKISTGGIYEIFRGLRFEPDTEIGQKGHFSKVSNGYLSASTRVLDSIKFQAK